MAATEQGYEDERFQNPVSQNLHCAICLNVFKDPVMCRNNQHYFCRHCITNHLENSNTCPTCQDELTVETLEDASRIMKEWLSELIICCDYHNRGCPRLIQLGQLQQHVMNCGFGPATCRNEGCLAEVNKQDLINHERGMCELRKVKCHECTKLKEDMAFMTQMIEGMEMKMKMSLGAVNEEMKEMKDEMKDGMKEMKDEVKVYLREIKDQLTTTQTTQHMTQCTSKEKENTSEGIGEDRSHSTKTEHNTVIAGGCGLNSVECFSWSQQSWVQLQPTKAGRDGASSFVFNNKMMIAGGWVGNGPTDSMEGLLINPIKNSQPWFDFAVKLTSKLEGHCSIVYDNKLITIGGHDGRKGCDIIGEVLLEPPYTRKLLTRMAQARWYHGAQLFKDQILICGGLSNSVSVDSVVMYNIVNNELKEMAPLPYHVHSMATVKYGENVVLIGGVGTDSKPLRSVVIYNVKTGKSYFLPVMKYKRGGSVAVVIGSSVVVMGGLDDRENELKSVEMFNFNSYSWEDLPPMNMARFYPTAIAY